MELGERIAVLREEQALTQAELAETARISPSTLSQIESGRVPRPHVGTVRKIARALGVEPADLRRAKELALPKTDAPREAGPTDQEDLPILLPAAALESIAELWSAQLSRGLYDLEILGEMYNASTLLAFNHEASIRKPRESLSSNFLEQLEAAEERFVAVDGQIWETLEKIRHDAPPDEVAKKRKEKEEARLQQLRGGKHARHA